MCVFKNQLIICIIRAILNDNFDRREAYCNAKVERILFVAYLSPSSVTLKNDFTILGSVLLFIKIGIGPDNFQVSL